MVSTHVVISPIVPSEKYFLQSSMTVLTVRKVLHLVGWIVSVDWLISYRITVGSAFLGLL